MEGPNGTVGHIPSSPTKGAAAGLVRIIGSLLLVARMVGLCLPENSEGFAAVARWEFYTSRGSLDSFLSSSEGRLFFFQKSGIDI